jgi:hypothetical protein
MTDDQRHICDLFEYALTQLRVDDESCAASDFADVVTCANEVLSDTVAELSRLKAKGRILGRWLPTAAGIAFGMGVKAVAPVPGTGSLAKAASGHFLRRWVAEATAADTALRFATNLQLAGRL